jgi:alkanesulfonate monooxygenase SsuD/methylene tetrahydromethanopterin reductase-like flavin-dependent oxidoreductase (luciferase family)
MNIQPAPPTPQFGISIDPSAADPQEPFRRAQIADEHGLDLITLMDHPYNNRLFDTWTLLTALAVRTQRVHVAGNVLSLPLRPPAMLAKMAATLDVLTGGRLEIGLGAGAYWDGIAAFGGPRRAAGEAYQAFEDALHILRGMWENAGRSFTYKGEVYQVRGAKPGPAPAHHIPIWVGATGPRMLRLTGRMADGLLISHNYVTPDKLAEVNERIDEGAEQAGRDPSAIRRGYNLMGVLDLGREDTKATGLDDNYVKGSVEEWVDKLVNWYHNDRQDTFIFWPVAGNQRLQIEAFAQDVVPAVREQLATVISL